MSQTSSVYFDL